MLDDIMVNDFFTFIIESFKDNFTVVDVRSTD